MKKILMLATLATVLVACDRHDRPATPSQTVTNTNMEKDIDNDNTGKNERDRNPHAKTSFDQSESEADRAISQKIRQAIVADDSLSTYAKNIKIITNQGVVTLRGPVNSQIEKENIAKKVKSIPGIKKVDNLLEINKDHHY